MKACGGLCLSFLSNTVLVTSQVLMEVGLVNKHPRSWEAALQASALTGPHGAWVGPAGQGGTGPVGPLSTRASHPPLHFHTTRLRRAPPWTNGNGGLEGTGRTHR